MGSVFITSENVSRPSYSTWLQSTIPKQTATCKSPCKQIGRKPRFFKDIVTKEKWLRHYGNPGCFVCSSCGELYSLFTMLKSVSHFTNCFPRCWLCLTMSPSFFTILFLFLPGFQSFVCMFAISLLCNFFSAQFCISAFQAKWSLPKTVGCAKILPPLLKQGDSNYAQILVQWRVMVQVYKWPLLCCSVLYLVSNIWGLIGDLGLVDQQQRVLWPVESWDRHISMLYPKDRK